MFRRRKLPADRVMVLGGGQRESENVLIFYAYRYIVDVCRRADLSRGKGYHAILEKTKGSPKEFRDFEAILEM